MTLLQAIKQASKIASKAAYSGMVVIYKDGNEYGVAEHTDSMSYNQSHEEIYSIPVLGYDHESATSLEAQIREYLGV